MYPSTRSPLSPIKHLTLGLKAASKGDFSKRLSPKSLDELGQLENHFNTFLTQLQMSNTKLHESEKGFRSIFENSVEGIFQFDIDGNILKVNPSFVSMLGYNNSQLLLDQKVNFYRDLIVRKELCNKIMETLIGERTVKGCSCRKEIRKNRKGKAILSKESGQ